MSDLPVFYKQDGSPRKRSLLRVWSGQGPLAAWQRRHLVSLWRFCWYRDACTTDLYFKRGVIRLRKYSRRIPAEEVPPRRRGLTLEALRAYYAPDAPSARWGSSRPDPPRWTLAFRLKVRRLFRGDCIRCGPWTDREVSAQPRMTSGQLNSASAVAPSHNSPPVRVPSAIPAHGRLSALAAALGARLFRMAATQGPPAARRSRSKLTRHLLADNLFYGGAVGGGKVNSRSPRRHVLARFTRYPPHADPTRTGA
jgi:hypothetical protein